MDRLWLRSGSGFECPEAPTSKMFVFRGGSTATATHGSSSPAGEQRHADHQRDHMVKDGEVDVVPAHEDQEDEPADVPHDRRPADAFCEEIGPEERDSNDCLGDERENHVRDDQPVDGIFPSKADDLGNDEDDGSDQECRRSKRAKTVSPRASSSLSISAKPSVVRMTAHMINPRSQIR